MSTEVIIDGKSFYEDLVEVVDEIAPIPKRTCIPWKEWEDRYIKNNYPSKPKEVILKSLSPRKWENIKKRASLLGVKRRTQNRGNYDSSGDRIYNRILEAQRKAGFI